MVRPPGTLADEDIRPALRSYLRGAHGCETDSVMLEEVGLCRGQVRVDLMVVNGLLYGYEIKSDRDSLRRLVDQVEFYNRVLDRETLVVGSRHIDEATKLLPAWWGILRIDPTPGDVRFITVRYGSQNPNRDPRSLVEMLWLENAMALLESRGAARGARGKPRRVVWDRVCDHFQLDEIATAVRTHLKARSTLKDPQLPSRGDGWCQGGATLQEIRV